MKATDRNRSRSPDDDQPGRRGARPTCRRTFREADAERPAAALFRARSASATSSISPAQIGIGADGKLPDGIEAQTKQTMDNIGAVLKRAGLSYSDLFHCTVMLADMKNWPAFNTVYVTYFPDGKLPARSAFGANGLALGRTARARVPGLCRKK